jgi:hypothetical protein
MTRERAARVLSDIGISWFLGGVVVSTGAPNGGVFDQDRAVGELEGGHLAARVDPEVRLTALLARVLMEKFQVILGTGFAQEEVRGHRGRAGGVIERHPPVAFLQRPPTS